MNAMRKTTDELEALADRVPVATTRAAASRRSGGNPSDAKNL